MVSWDELAVVLKKAKKGQYGCWELYADGNTPSKARAAQQSRNEEDGNDLAWDRNILHCKTSPQRSQTVHLQNLFSRDSEEEKRARPTTGQAALLCRRVFHAHAVTFATHQSAG